MAGLQITGSHHCGGEIFPKNLSSTVMTGSYLQPCIIKVVSYSARQIGSLKSSYMCELCLTTIFTLLRGKKE